MRSGELLIFIVCQELEEEEEEEEEEESG